MNVSLGLPAASGSATRLASLARQFGWRRPAASAEVVVSVVVMTSIALIIETGVMVLHQAQVL